jgi:hypothetical protein
VPGDTNGGRDIFVYDFSDGTLVRASTSATGAQASGESLDASISADGRYVAFESSAEDLVPGDDNGRTDVFVKDLQTGATELVSLSSGGVQGDGTCQTPALSPDGRFVVFTFFGTNLVPGDTNGVGDAFLRDRQNGTTERVSLGSGGGQANGTAWEPRVSDDGRFVAYADNAPNLVPYDLNGTTDVFLRDRQPVLPAFTSLCDPGVGAVIACPCSNPPAGSGQGCDHSGATGGASLFATGNTQVSADGLVFTTSGERASALSILVQGNAVLPAGLVYGQGVRCVGGTLRRLYTKSASGGAILAPDLDAGDPPVTVRSAQKGDFISGGQSRWYMVYYRDPTVLGGCPATSTFNSTQTGEIAWAP